MTEQHDKDSLDVGGVSDTIDARGLACPLPLLRAKQALNGVGPGERIKVLATDSGSVRDFHSFAELSGHTLCAFDESGQVYTYILQKRG